MSKLILTLPFVGLLLSGLTTLSKPKTETAAAAAPGASISFERPVFQVQQLTASPKAPLILYFGLPYPDRLGVIDPDGRFFYVVFPQEEAIGRIKPLVDSDEFAQMTSLQIIPGALTADPYVYGVTENQPVFTKNGRYRFVLGDNLHVDDPALVQTVEVAFKQ